MTKTTTPLHKTTLPKHQNRKDLSRGFHTVPVVFSLYLSKEWLESRAPSPKELIAKATLEVTRRPVSIPRWPESQKILYVSVIASFKVEMKSSTLVVFPGVKISIKKSPCRQRTTGNFSGHSFDSIVSPSIPPHGFFGDSVFKIEYIYVLFNYHVIIILLFSNV